MPNVGLHIDQNTISIAIVKKTPSGLAVESVKEIDSSAALLSSDFIGRHTEITTGLPIKDVLLRSLEMPITKKRALKQALPFQLESQFPYPLNELIILPSFTQVDKGSTHVRALAAHHKTVEDHLQKLQDMGLSAHWVSSEAIALERYVHHFYPELNPFIAIFVGPHETSIIAKKDGKIVGSSAFSIGAQTISQSTEPSKVKTKFLHELDRSIHYLKSKCKAALHWHVLPLGSAEKLIDQTLENDTMTFVQERVDKRCAPFAMAVGLAFDTAMRDVNTCQFRQGFYTSSHHLAKLGKRLCYSLFLSALLALASIVTTKHLQHQKTQHILKEIDAFNTAFEITSSQSTRDIADVKQIEYKIDELKSQLRQQKGFFPMHLTVPRVTHVLEALSTHDVLSNPTHNMAIDELAYSLDSYPTLNHINTNYSASLALSLDIPSSSSATQLADALKEDRELIDKSKEVELKRKASGYTLKCHLKKGVR